MIYRYCISASTRPYRTPAWRAMIYRYCISVSTPPYCTPMWRAMIYRYCIHRYCIVTVSIEFYTVDTKLAEMALLPSTNEVNEGYVFTRVCHSFHRGVSASVHVGIHTPPVADTPSSRHPPSRRLPLRTVRILLECILVVFKGFNNSKRKLPPVGLDLMLQIITGLGVQCLTNWAKLTFAGKSKTFRSIYSMLYWF